jgi:hypothetical protein
MVASLLRQVQENQLFSQEDQLFPNQPTQKQPGFLGRTVVSSILFYRIVSLGI